MSRARDLSRLSNSQAFSVDSNFNVGINTDNPQVELDVSGNANISGNISVGGTITYDDVTNVDSIGIVTARSGVDVGTPGSINASILPNGDANFSGSLGVGTSSPANVLEAAGDNAAGNGIGNVEGILRVNNNTTAFGSSPTAGIVFATKYRTSPDVPLDGAAIYGGKENAADANKSFYLAFATRAESGNNGNEAMRIDSSGRILVGTSSSLSTLGFAPNFQVEGDSAATSSGSFLRTSSDDNPSYIGLCKKRGSGGNVNSGDNIGRLSFRAFDGVNFLEAATIDSFVDGVVNTQNDMPGSLVFSTTADGDPSPTERMRIDSSGRLLVGTSGDFGSGSTGDKLQVATSAGGHLLTGRNDSTVTTDENMGLWRGYSYGGSVWEETARVSMQADGAHASGDKPGRLVFSTTADGASSPTERMRIDSSGRLLVGTSSSRVIGNVGNYGSSIQVESTTYATLSLTQNSNDSIGSILAMGKSRGGIGSNTVVQNDDTIGDIRFAAADGSSLTSQCASITVKIDGTPSAGDVPGRLEFWTTAVGLSSPTERMRITSDGTVRLLNSPGIDFSDIQTNAAGMTSETLDSYEEGDWSDSIGYRGYLTAGTYTLTDKVCYYTKIGNQVTVWGRITVASGSGGAGYAEITGLPFAYKANSRLTGSVWFRNWTTGLSGTIVTASVTVPTSGQSATFLVAISRDNNTDLDYLPVDGFHTNNLLAFTFRYTVS